MCALSTPPWILPLRQSASDAAGGDHSLATASPAPREKQIKSGSRKTWDRVGSGHAQEPEDMHTGTQRSSGSAHHAVPEGDEFCAFESNHQHHLPPPQARQTGPSARECATAALSNNGADGSTSTGLEVLPPAGPDFDTPPQQDGGGAPAITRSGSGGRSNSSGSGGKRVVHDRKRIATTPVWKRPAVPLSQPYVPVPKKASGRM